MITRRLPGLTLCGASLLTALLAACSTTNPDLLTADGDLLEDEPPAPYRIALIPAIAGPGFSAGLEENEEGLRFTMPSSGFQEALVERMNTLRAASHVFAADDEPSAIRLGADLIIKPRLQETPSLEHVGASDNVWSSGLLWITTWIGGMFVEDATYEVNVSLQCEFINAATTRLKLEETIASDRVDLTFWERNSAASWPTVQSFVLPPFWTTDESDQTSQALTDQAVDQIAARLTRFVKLNLPQRERDAFGQIDITTPEPLEDVGSTASVNGAVRALAPIRTLSIMVNEDRLAFQNQESIDALLAVPNAQQQGDEFSIPWVAVVEGLKTGENTISIEAGFGLTELDWTTTRTLVIYNGPTDDDSAGDK